MVMVRWANVFPTLVQLDNFLALPTLLFYLVSSISPKQRLQAHYFSIVYRIPCQVKQKQAFLTLIHRRSCLTIALQYYSKVAKTNSDRSQ